MIIPHDNNNNDNNRVSPGDFESRNLSRDNLEGAQGQREGEVLCCCALLQVARSAAPGRYTGYRGNGRDKHKAFIEYRNITSYAIL